MALKVPTRATLRKYGMSEDDWRWLEFLSGGLCGVCGNEFGTKAVAIDHVHARGFKRMSPAEKRLCVRGLVHRLPCNRYYVAKLTLDTARAVVRYLERERPFVTREDTHVG
jgi:hypothetical protein